MKQEALSFFTDTWLTLIALLIFFSFFIILTVVVMRTKKSYIDRMSNLPLEESSNE